MFNFGEVVDATFDDQTVFPAVADKDGTPLWLPEDGETRVVQAISKIEVWRGDPRSKVWGLKGLKNANLWVTDSRVVFVCKDYDQGGGWVSLSPATMMLANSASKALARFKTRGTFLVGQIRYPYLFASAYTNGGRWEDECILFNFVDGSVEPEEVVSVRCYWRRGSKAEEFGQQLRVRIAKARLDDDVDDLLTLADLETIKTPPKNDVASRYPKHVPFQLPAT